MSLLSIPDSITAIDPTRWETYQPYFEELSRRPIQRSDVSQWLKDWSNLMALLGEAASMIYIEKSLDTADPDKERAFLQLVDHVLPYAEVAENGLKERLLGLGPQLEALGGDVQLVLRDFRNEAELFHRENVPLKTALAKLDNEYDKITGNLTAEWDGEQKNLSQLNQLLYEQDRSLRERAWRTMMGLWLDNRERLNQIYGEMLQLRQQIARNLGLPDYRAFAFRDLRRFDYTPEDCFAFHSAIETVVVPAARRLYQKKQARLGIDRLRPWDTDVEARAAPPLRPYEGQQELIRRSHNIFQHLDAELGGYFGLMAAESLLDLETRHGKALGGYCSTLPLRRRPFIFMNGVGQHDDVRTILHESGHAFHVFEAASWPLIWQREAPMEFCEVASMSMELLAAPYLTRDQGGFYNPADAARARIEHLEQLLLFLPYMAVVDAFQHWVYTHPDKAKDSTGRDATWMALWQRFMPGVDWRGFDSICATGWHRKPHIFGSPFYYIEYGMAQVGAMQLWRNSLADHGQALAAYRRALSLGGTRTLPQLFAAAGIEFRFDELMLAELVALVEQTIAELEDKVPANGH